MAKTINFSGTADDVSTDDRDAVLGAADGWHDPGAGNVVNHITYTYAGDDDATPALTVAVRIEGVAVDDVQAERDALASAIDSLPLNFGSMTELKEQIDIQ